MTNEKNFRKVISYIPDRIATELKNLPAESAGMINEIRLRINRNNFHVGEELLS